MQPRTSSLVARFHRTVLAEFLQEACRIKLSESMASLQEDFASWLHSYNYDRPPQGYRHMEGRPLDTINLFLQNIQKEGWRYSGKLTFRC